MDKQALIKKCVSKLNPIDDLMFRKMAEEKEFCEEMLRTILGDPQLIVLEIKPNGMEPIYRDALLLWMSNAS